MRVFGPAPWNRVLGAPVATPVGEACGWCGEPIGLDDSGVIMPLVEGLAPGSEPADPQPFVQVRMVAEHRECWARQIVGSIGHQLGLCSCNGGPGTLDDPQGLTKRQAARAAVALADLTIGPDPVGPDPRAH